MPIQLVDLLTEADRALVHRAVDGFVPRKIFDAHAHLFHTRHFAQGNRPAFLPQDTAFGFKAYHEALDRWLPGREIEGLFFPYPCKSNNRSGENRFLAAELDAHLHLTPTRRIALHHGSSAIEISDQPAEGIAHLDHVGTECNDACTFFDEHFFFAEERGNSHMSLWS